jgi:tripartite motif-containing protein 71
VLATSKSGTLLLRRDQGDVTALLDSQGRFLRKWGTQGREDGQFGSPLPIDGGGNVYVAGMTNDRIQVFDPQGRFLHKWGTLGTGDGRFNLPLGLAIADDGNIYVADTGNRRIQVFERVSLNDTAH